MKMNKLSLDNQNNKNNEYYWNQINNLKWFYLANDYKNEANDVLSEFLVKNYTIEDIIELQNFIVKQREIVKNYILGFLRGCPSYEKAKYKLNSDGTWDLASHIVGMGKVTMDLIFRKPEIIFILQDIKVENFEYGFDSAIYELKNIEMNKE
jgi:hypothetical protein